MPDNNIFSVSYTESNETKIEYNPGNKLVLTGALIACLIKNKEIREAVFNATVNAIAISECPQEWLNAINNGVKTAREKSRIEAENIVS